ncbi:uncharacterized protein [Dysidea avara]|uniref:uncharacterized protein n=1 Tax=Dysidea avara TaxID=196820 RepID=UPI0033276DE0
MMCPALVVVFSLSLVQLQGLICSANTIHHKPFGNSITLPCHDCTDICKVNGIHVDGLVQDGNVIIPANDWSIYGTICCSGGQETCYQICPPLKDRCDSFLTISTNEMTVMEGDVVSFRTAILQRPHSGISLMVNGSDALTSSNFDCTSPSNVLSNEVVYSCTPRSVGMTSVQGHTIFCDVECYSQQLLVEIKRPPPAIYPTNTTAVQARLISNTVSSNITSSKHMNLTTTVILSITSSPETDNNKNSGSGDTVLIVLSIMIPLLIVPAVAVMLFVLYCKIKKRLDRKHVTPTTHPSDDDNIDAVDPVPASDHLPPIQQALSNPPDQEEHILSQPHGDNCLPSTSVLLGRTS